MITRIEANRFRCLRHVNQDLGAFHVLVGPNASGKTTFLDTVGFLERMVSDGIDAAVTERTSNFADLVWGRGEPPLNCGGSGGRRISCREKRTAVTSFRYEVEVGVDEETRRRVSSRRPWLKQPFNERQRRTRADSADGILHRPSNCGMAG